MVYLGVDVGGTGVKVGIVNETGVILHKDSIPTYAQRPFNEIVADIAALCKKVLADTDTALSEVTAIGIGVPGIADRRSGLTYCTNLNWHGVPFVAEMKKYFDLPIVVDNDATVAGLAEAVAGVSKGAHSCVFITLGTGVGGGIIINDRPYSGAHGVGSEIGHMILRMGGEPCTCGNNGCFERYASATAIIREARKAAAEHPESAMAIACGGDLEKMNAKIVIDSAKAQDPTACKVFGDYVDALAFGIVSIINVLDPEIIAIGGGVSAAGEFLLSAIRDSVKEKVFFKSLPYARIELAKMGNDAGIIGAAMLGRP